MAAGIQRMELHYLDILGVSKGRAALSMGIFILGISTGRTTLSMGIFYVGVSQV